MERVFLSLGENYSSSSPRVAVSLAQAHTPRGCCRWIKGQMLCPTPPARRVRGVSWTEIGFLSFHKCTWTNTPLLPRGQPLLPQLLCFPPCFLFHFRTAAENSCLDPLPNFICPSYLLLREVCPFFSRGWELNNINYSFGIESPTCPLIAPLAKDGMNQSTPHIFKENAYSSQIFDDFYFPL